MMMNMFNQNQIMEIIRQYNGGIGITTIGKNFGVNHKTISKYLKSNNIKINSERYKSKLSSDQIESICDLFETGEYSLNALGREFNVNHATIGNILRRKGLTGRQKIIHYSCNTGFFRTINTEEKAYWLGFIYADGGVCVSKSGSVYITIELSSLDLEHLKLFLRSIESTHPIKSRDNNVKSKIIIGSIEMGTDLYNLGCPPHKTYSIQWPTDEIVPQHLKRHFLRGYSDGDGTFGTCKTNPATSIRWELCLTYPFGVNLKKWLKNQCDTGDINIKPYRNIFRLKYAGRCQVSRVWHLLYDDATIFLPRKKEVIKQYIYPSDWCNITDGRKFNPKYNQESVAL